MSKKKLNDLICLLRGVLDVMFKGGKVFYVWMFFLTILILSGIVSYNHQVMKGLSVTNMREQVSWGFYISNFTFLVGIAAAAVLLIIPAYIYSFKAIKKIVAFGELLAVSAIITALLFIFVDFGRPERFWHAMPPLGVLNFPSSILAWDMLVLNGYLVLNLFISLYLGVNTYLGREPNKKIVIPLILLSIPWAVGVHTVTAFVYNGLAARPFWNASILAPRFLASAFCSGPALMIIIFQILRKVTDFKIENKAIFKISEMIAYAMAINVFLLSAEIFKEYYSGTVHLLPMTYLYRGIDGHDNLVPWIWTAMVFNTIGLIFFLVPQIRKRLLTLNIGCILIFIGIWIEKGMGLIIPGFIPDALGEIYEYMPSRYEVMTAGGIWAFGAMTYTLFVRTAIAIDTGILRHPGAPPIVHEAEGHFAKDLMSTKLITVAPETSVEEISKILLDNRISGVPVLNEENKVVGVVSGLDIIFSEIHKEPHLLEKLGGIVLSQTDKGIGRTGNTAAQIMTSPPITAREGTTLAELIRIVTEKKIKRIIIIDKEGYPLGIVSRIDIVRALEKVDF